LAWSWKGRFPLDEPSVFQSAIEARAEADVTGAAVAARAHLDQHRVLVAVDPQFDDVLQLAAGLALLPELSRERLK
jgi:hypothetical protein